MQTIFPFRLKYMESLKSLTCHLCQTGELHCNYFLGFTINFSVNCIWSNYDEKYFSNALSVIDLLLIFQEKNFNLALESNPEPLVFLASVQTVTPFRFKYQDRLKSLSCMCYDNLTLWLWQLSLNYIVVTLFNFRINFSINNIWTNEYEKYFLIEVHLIGLLLIFQEKNL